MTQFDGGRLVVALLELEKAKNALAVSGAPSYASMLGNFESACRDLPLSSDFKSSVRRLIEKAARETETVEVIRALGQEIESRFLGEYRSFGFYAVPAARLPEYTDPLAWFDSKAIARFSDIHRDVIGACQCYALGCWTASVFHCMRVLELGLRALATHVGVTLKIPLDFADWQDLLGGIDHQIKVARGTPRSQARSDELDALSRAGSDMRYCQNAWRDHVSHSRAHYCEQDAREVLGHVNSIMGNLALLVP